MNSVLDPNRSPTFPHTIEKRIRPRKSLEKRIETMDRHCAAILTAEPPEPKPCLFAESPASARKTPVAPI
jgi:hypothetical protein